MVGEVDYLKHEMERKDKEIAEDKDRITALENQIEEYAGTIDDQNRVSYCVHVTCDNNVYVHVDLLILILTSNRHHIHVHA